MLIGPKNFSIFFTSGIQLTIEVKFYDQRDGMTTV